VITINIKHILGEIGLKEGGFVHHSTSIKAFDRFQMKIWRVLLPRQTQLRDLSSRAAIDAMFFDLKNVSTTLAGQIIV